MRGLSGIQQDVICDLVAKSPEHAKDQSIAVAICFIVRITKHHLPQRHAAVMLISVSSTPGPSTIIRVLES